MTKAPIAVVVPRELYYHEVAYVRGLEAEIARLRNLLDEANAKDAALKPEGETK